jgi:hypothetical protein
VAIKGFGFIEVNGYWQMKSKGIVERVVFLLLKKTC